MNLSAFLSSGTLTALLPLASALSIAFGKPAFAAFLSDPDTATTVTAVFAGVTSLVAGALKGVRPAAAA